MSIGQAPKVFISYSWDDEEHKAWVRNLAAKLRMDAVDVTLDQWHIKLGDQLPHFMEQAIRENDFVLIVCTPKYKAKSEKRTGGVGYEGDIIQSEVFATGNHRKFIPVLRNGKWTESAPSELLGKLYVSLANSDQYKERYMQLLNTLHGTAEEAPPIGVRSSVTIHDACWSQQRKFTEHPNSIDFMAISDDGDFIASVSQGLWNFSERCLRMWRPDSNQYLILEPESKSRSFIRGLAMTGDGKKLVIAAKYTERITFVNGDARRKFLQAPHQEGPPVSGFSPMQNLKHIAITGDGACIVAYDSNNIYEWTDLTAEPIVTQFCLEANGAFSDPVSSIAMDREGRILLLSLGGQAILYNLENKLECGVLRCSVGKLQFIALSCDGSTALTFSSKVLNVWDLRSQSVKRTILQQSRSIECAALSRDGSVVAVGLESGDVEVHFLTENRIESFYCGKQKVTRIAITPDKTTILVALLDCSLSVWKRSAIEQSRY